MSLWACVEHGLTGPQACCGKASLSSMAMQASIAQLEAEVKALTEIADHRLERTTQLEAALHELLSSDFHDTATMERIEALLTTSETGTELVAGKVCSECLGQGFVFTYPNNQPQSMDCPSCTPTANRKGVANE